MCCILVTGIPAAGKSTMEKYLAEHLSIPVISKDMIKELLFDTWVLNQEKRKWMKGEKR